MILFHGYRDDSPMTRALEAAAAIGVEHWFVDQRTAAHNELVLRISDDGVDGELTLAGARVPLAEVDGIYSRPLTSVGQSDVRGTERAACLDRGLVEWMDMADCRVVSRPSAMHSNASKPFQAQAIAAAGLDVPTTLITTDPDTVREFWATHGSIVFKSISGIRSIVQQLDDERAATLERVRNLPTQFQVMEDGVDVRVHVVGERVFAAEICSDAVDYRYAHSAGLEANLTAIDLPDEVAGACVSLSRRLDLPFSGIDLRRRPDGTHVCFEVNPMPGYSYFENETGLPISAALVEYLAGKSR